MIAYLHGPIAELEATHVVVDCGGVGYLAKISLQTYSQIQGKEKIKLHTYLQVREDAQVLYGFADVQERGLFEQLIGISGVGGNTALMILSSLSAEELFRAIRTEDVLTLKKVKGIGAKTAGRIVLELKDKLKLEGVSLTASSASGAVQSQKREEALTALKTLGLPKATMEKKVDQILKTQGGEISVAEIIKLALKN